MQRILNKEIVQGAINQLQTEGKNPSVANIRGITGGSNLLIMKLRAELVTDNVTMASNDNVIKNDNVVQSDLMRRLQAIEQRLAALEVTQPNHSNDNVTHDNEGLLQVVADLRNQLAARDAELASLRKQLQEKNEVTHHNDLPNDNDNELRHELKQVKQDAHESGCEVIRLMSLLDERCHINKNALSLFFTRWGAKRDSLLRGCSRTYITKMLNEFQGLLL